MRIDSRESRNARSVRSPGRERGSGSYGRNPMGAYTLCGVTVFLLLVPAAFCARRGEPAIVELDLRSDVADAYALATAVRSEGLDLVGVVVPGVDGHLGARAVAKLLQILGRPDIPVCESGMGDASAPVFLEWGRDGALPSGAPGSATELIRSQSERFERRMQYLGLGTLRALDLALHADADLSRRVFRVVFSIVPPNDWKSQLRSSPQVLDATFPVIVFGPAVTSRAALTEDDLKDIARARTPLTDELSRMAALSREDGTIAEGLPIPHCLAVAYMNGSLSYEFERAVCDRGKEGEPGKLKKGERSVKLARDSDSGELLQGTVQLLEDIRPDFAFFFSQFLADLINLDNDTRKSLIERMDQSPQPAEPPPGLTDAEKFRYQLVDFAESKMAVFLAIDNPSVQRPLGHLKEAYLRFAGIGWWFPESFYERWVVDATPSETLHLEFGVSNETHRDLSEIELFCRVGEMTQTEKVASATGDVVGRFGQIRFPGAAPFPETVEIGRRFECHGVPFAATKVLPLAIAKPQQVSPAGQETGR